MKISVFSLSDIPLGKNNVKDSRLDQADKLVKAKKKTYAQVELAGEPAAPEADIIIIPKDTKADLILRDLEFIETRLGRNPGEKEAAVLNKIKLALEKEEFVSSVGLEAEEKELISGYALLTFKPVAIVEEAHLREDAGSLLSRVLAECGFISFLTVGDKENRAWLVKKGTTAWEAAGVIHSDIQRGFIRAEIISFSDFISCGGEAQAKQAGKMRLEPKEYVMQDADLANFRFNR